MKKQMRSLLVICLLCLLAVCAAYLGLAVYYRDGFSLNTWINGVYCTGKTVEEVNAELLAQYKPVGAVEVTGYDAACEDEVKKSWTIDLTDMDIVVDYSDRLEEYLENQNPWLWADNLTFHTAHVLKPDISYPEEELGRKWEKIRPGMCKDGDYRIEYSEARGYALHDGLRILLDEAKAFQLLLEAIAAGHDRVDLVDEGCYYVPDLSEEQTALSVLWQKINAFQENGPVYHIGDDRIRLEGAVMAGFLQKAAVVPYLPLTDGQGCLRISEEAVDQFARDMVERHSTQGKEWKFQSTRGDIVTVKGVTYGTVIDLAEETAWLREYLERLSAGQAPRSLTAHIPEYTREAFNNSSTTLGGTYVEVDMGLQKLYYYEGGKMMLETDIVTGNAGRGMSTPEGVNYVYAKQRNRVLRGQGYASPVSYWMPVKGSIGIHDANWRGQFGGEIYKTGGSHGCINVPPKVMPELYDMVEIGTPVVMFYGEEL